MLSWNYSYINTDLKWYFKKLFETIVQRKK